MIKAMGLERERVYIANIIKCRPPNNRTPERDECETCSPFLMRQVATIKPLRLFLQSNNYLAVVFCALAVDSALALPKVLGH